MQDGSCYRVQMNGTSNRTSLLRSATISAMKRVKKWLTDTLVASAYVLLSLGFVLLVWLVSGHLRTAFRGRVDWPVRTGNPDDNAPVPAWLFYVVFPTVVIAMTATQVTDGIKRRKRRAAPWWDYTDDQINAMSLQDLRGAYERAIEELEPLPPAARASSRAQATHERYVRLRDAYYARRPSPSKHG